MSYLKRYFKSRYPKQKSQKRNRSYKEYLHLSYSELKKKETETNKILSSLNIKINNVRCYWDLYNKYLESKKKISNELWTKLHEDDDYKIKRKELDEIKVKLYDLKYTRFIFKAKFTELDAKKKSNR